MWIRGTDLNGQGLFQRRGSVAACAVLLVANHLAPFVLAGDGGCRSQIDLNCDLVVDGQDLSLLLGGWGSNSPGLDFDGDCSVGGGDLAIMLGGWGALPDVPDMSPVSIAKQISGFCLSSGRIEGVVSAEVALQSDELSYDGWASVNLNDNIYVSMEFSENKMQIFVEETTVSVSSADPVNQISVNGQLIPVGEVLDRLYFDVSYAPQSSAEWSGTTQALVGLGLLHSTDQFVRNVQAQREAGGYGFWCKLYALVLGGLVTTFMTMGCLALAKVCHSVTVITIGGTAFLCADLLALCAGAVFVGGAGAYEFALNYWGSGNPG